MPPRRLLNTNYHGLGLRVACGPRTREQFPQYNLFVNKGVIIMRNKELCVYGP